MDRMLRLSAPVKSGSGAPTTRQMEEPRRERLVPREAFVWAYVVALAGLAGSAWLFVTHGDVPHADPHLPWWAVALGFALAELIRNADVAPRPLHTRVASPPDQGGGGEASVTGGLKVLVGGARDRPGDQ
jgi:hypothetical protein